MDINISELAELETFLNTYTKYNGETIRIAKSVKLTERSQYKLVNYYRCQHDTRVLSTRNVAEILEKNPSKRLKKYELSVQTIVKSYERDVFGVIPMQD